MCSKLNLKIISVVSKRIRENIIVLDLIITNYEINKALKKQI